MIGKKIAAFALLMTAAAAGAVAPANAGGPPDYAGCTITVDPSSFEPGDTVTVAGTGLQPSFETPIEFNSVTVVVGTVTTDAEGAFETTITIPADAAQGDHTITAECDAVGNVSITDVTVEVSGNVIGPPLPRTGGNGGNGGPLPRTGSDVEPLVVVGGAAVLAGVAFVLVAKRRRRTVA